MVGEDGGVLNEDGESVEARGVAASGVAGGVAVGGGGVCGDTASGGTAAEAGATAASEMKTWALVCLLLVPATALSAVTAPAASPPPA